LILFCFVGADVVGIELSILVVWIGSFLVRWVGSFTLGCGVRSLISGFWGDLVASSKITGRCSGVAHSFCALADSDTLLSMSSSFLSASICSNPC
jgi:hypothetical protein